MAANVCVGEGVGRVAWVVGVDDGDGDTGRVGLGVVDDGDGDSKRVGLGDGAVDNAGGDGEAGALVARIGGASV